jgi:hypothetical protein
MWKGTGGRTREVTLDPGASTDTPVRRQRPGRSLPGPDAGHPLQGAGNRGFMDWGTASDELLAVLRTWGVQPYASGKYPVRPDVSPGFAKEPWGFLWDIPTAG